MKRYFLLAIVLFSFAGFVTAQSNKSDAAITGLIRKMSDAQTSYDQKALDSIFTTDFVEISPVGEYDDRSKVLSFYTPEAKAAQSKISSTVEVSEVTIRHYDNVAVAIAKFTYNIKNDGQSLPPRSMRVTIVCRKEKGEWKIASTQYTGIRPPAPPKTN